jgi:hypothetical protein
MSPHIFSFAGVFLRGVFLLDLGLLAAVVLTLVVAIIVHFRHRGFHPTLSSTRKRGSRVGGTSRAA